MIPKSPSDLMFISTKKLPLRQKFSIINSNSFGWMVVRKLSVNFTTGASQLALKTRLPKIFPPIFISIEFNIFFLFYVLTFFDITIERIIFQYDKLPLAIVTRTNHNFFFIFIGHCFGFTKIGVRTFQAMFKI